MKLKKCSCCKTYTLKDSCPKENCDCGQKTKSAHYKHIKINKGNTGKVKGKA